MQSLDSFGALLFLAPLPPPSTKEGIFLTSVNTHIDIHFCIPNINQKQSSTDSMVFKCILEQPN